MHFTTSPEHGEHSVSIELFSDAGRITYGWHSVSAYNFSDAWLGTYGCSLS